MQEDEKEPRPAPATRLERLRQAIARRAENPGEKEKWLLAQLRLVRLQRLPVELWAVMGEEEDYLLIPDTYCSCPHFTIRVVHGESSEPCYHLVAVRMARLTGRFNDLSETLSPEDVQGIILELLVYPRSPSLRRFLHLPRRG